MRVGVSGHQARPGIDWNWVADAVRAELAQCSTITQALTSLAVGSDQIFAQCALEMNVPVLAVIPIHNYESFFEGDGLARYRELLAASERLDLNTTDEPEPAFYAAGRYIVERCDLLLAIWDGKPAAGLGGTGDAVEYALQQGRSCIIIDPIQKTVSRINRGE
ncbi:MULTISPECIES: hypothetical protein [Methylorubrum]|uniref:Uncharacterized protein n=2 Tax=Methylorubrum TaxID=2282523 RepID=A0AA40VD59_9HYPH|nr:MULTISPECIES: hypothetical protein [Methylorubrum]MBA8916049.1 hypothetical protein [Methylorubrum thiocyanatum]